MSSFWRDLAGGVALTTIAVKSPQTAANLIRTEQIMGMMVLGLISLGVVVLVIAVAKSNRNKPDQK